MYNIIDLIHGVLVVYLIVFIHYGIKFFKKAIAWLDTH